MVHDGKIKLVLADDHMVFRNGLQAILENERSVDVVSAVADGVQLVKMAHIHRPDIVLTDIKMPEMNGIEATRLISNELPAISVIAISMFNDEGLLIDMLDAGACGYLLKSAGRNEIVDAIRSVYAGGNYYCRDTAVKLAGIALYGKGNPYKQRSVLPSFSPKELDVIRYLCEELSSHEIAERMEISKRTIDGMRLRIQDKMQVKSTVGIVLYAVKKGICQM